MLKAAMNNPELEDLANVIEKCHKVKITDDDDDVRAAKNKLGYLKVKSGNKSCLGLIIFYMNENCEYGISMNIKYPLLNHLLKLSE